MQDKSEYVDHEIHGNSLRKEYISPSPSKLKNPHVESGFIKIQNIDTSNMTVEEHTACQHLRLNNNDGNNENENNDYDLYEKGVFYSNL